MNLEPIQLQSKSHDYVVRFVGTIEEATSVASRKPNTFWLVDRNVRRIHPMAFSAIPENQLLEIDATEEQKSYEAIAPLFLHFLSRGIRRDSTLVAVGGGITQDIACFIASVLARGIRWELIPTTLLAQVDSCIGSKSSINIGSFKNQIGTFYSPHAITLPLEATDSLDEQEIHSGIGEILKFVLLTDEAIFQEFLSDTAGKSGSRDWIPKWIHKSLLIKKPFIEEDEFDRGRRNLLNYGHTFGHAFESATHYGLPHGIAVIFGILAATFISSKLEMVPSEHFKLIRNSLNKWSAPYVDRLLCASLDDILGAMKHDKKNTGAGINCILTRGFGKMERIPIALENKVRPLLSEYLTEMRKIPESTPNEIANKAIGDGS